MLRQIYTSIKRLHKTTMHQSLSFTRKSFLCLVVLVASLAIVFLLTTSHSLLRYKEIILRSSGKAHESWLSDIVLSMKVKDRDCVAFFNTSTKVDSDKKNVGQPISDETYLNITTNCTSFQKSRGYIMSSLTKEEEDFPLAFSLIVYKDAEMVERLFRAIYRPQNYYCFHVDAKSPPTFYRSVSAIVQCFPNAFMTSRRINVQWGYFSVLKPELLCMEELWRFTKWRYFINLTGQEFPLKTNLELVNIFTAYKGANDVSTTAKR